MIFFFTKAQTSNKQETDVKRSCDWRFVVPFVVPVSQRDVIDKDTNLFAVPVSQRDVIDKDTNLFAVPVSQRDVIDKDTNHFIIKVLNCCRPS